MLRSPEFIPLYKEVQVKLVFPKKEQLEVRKWLNSIGIIDPAKSYELNIKKHREKRSLDANAYFWKLCGELATELSNDSVAYSKDDIYREYIRNYGVFETVQIKEIAIERWTQCWGLKGYGWICEDMGEDRIKPGYHNINCYYGSSSYNTKEMSRLIDAVVQDCKEYGIETWTPDEIEHLKEMWNGRVHKDTP